MEHKTSVNKTLHQSGCLHIQIRFFFVWQETHNRTLYDTLHTCHKKKLRGLSPRANCHTS